VTLIKTECYTDDAETDNTFRIRLSNDGHRCLRLDMFTAASVL